MSQAMHGTVSKLFGNSIIVGKDSMFINNVDVTGIKEFDDVEYSKVGFNLETIKKVGPAAPVSTQPEVMKSGGGKISVIDLDKPYFEYTFTIQGSLATARFYQISDAAKAHLSGYHVGDEISATWTVVDGNKKTLQGVGPKQNKFGGKGGGKPFDPVADAKRQRMIVRQSCLDRAVTLWIEIHKGDKVCKLSDITDVASQFEQWVMREGQ